MTKRYTEGSLSAATLLLLFFLTTLVLGLIAISVQLRRPMVARERRLDLLEAADSIIDRFVDLLQKDQTPESDGPSDQMWLLAEEAGVFVEDISSGYNPNWLRKRIIELPLLGTYLRDGARAEEIQQRRFTTGPSLDLAIRFGDLIVTERDDVTPYGLFNVNTTDESVLEWIVATRTGKSERGTEFRLGVINRLAAFSRIEAAELNILYRTDQQLLWPLITSEASWNIHYVPDELLLAIVSFEPFQIANPERAALSLASIRKRNELSPSELPSLIGVEPTHRILEFFGTQTWFWRVRVERDGFAAEYIVLNTPSEPPFSSERNAMILERHIDYTGSNL